MNKKKIKLVAFSFILGFAFLNDSLATDKIITDPNPKEFLDELNIARDLKQKKHDHFEINKWKPSYRKLLKENGEKWSTAHRQAKDSLVEYLDRLTAAYVHLPENHDSFEKVKEELIAQHPEHNKKKLTESYHNQLSLISNACHPELINGRILPKKASFLAKLLKPTGSIKFEDRMRFIGITVEPQNGIFKQTIQLPNFVLETFTLPERKTKNY